MTEEPKEQAEKAPEEQAEKVKTEMEEIAYADEFQEYISVNDDVEISEELAYKIKNAKETTLLKIVKVIGSHPVTIKSVEEYTEDFMLKNF